MKYRKLPVEIEAFEWTGDNLTELMEWEKIHGINEPIFLHGTDQLTIPTLEGDHIASPGDYIIQGVQGEIYPCKPEIFKQTYEPVAEA